MVTINASPERSLQLGYAGEDKVTKVIFPYDESWLEYGDGEFFIRVLRPGDTEPYNAQDVTNDSEAMTLTLVVTDVELSRQGYGQMQVVYIGPQVVKKSRIYAYRVSKAIDEPVDPPNGSIINQIVQSLGDLADLTTEAKTDLVSAINEVNERGGASVTVDDALSTTSTNPVQNKVITSAVHGKADIQTVSAIADAVNGLDLDVQGLQTAMQSKADKTTATTSADGLMSAQDKSKLDAVGSVVTVSGTAPVITAVSGVRYVCGEVATLDFTPCASGICDVVFTSGNTPTVVTLPNTVKFPDGSFVAEADTTYEINILDGVYGAVMSWA